MDPLDVVLARVMPSASSLVQGSVLLRRRRASRSPTGCRRRSASAGEPDADIRTDRPTVVGEGDRPDPQLVPVVALDHIGQGSDRSRAATLEGGEDRALGVDRRRGTAGPRGRPGRPPGRRRRSGTRSPAHPARGRGASAAGRAPRWPRRAVRAGPARPEPVRRRRTHRSGPCRSWCPRCPGCRRHPNRGRARGAGTTRRGEPVPTREPAGSSPSVSPSRATTTSRGSSRGGYGGERDPVARAGGQVLERVDGEVDPAVEQGVAQRAHEDAGAADLGERADGRVALGRDLDQLDLPAQPVAHQVGDQGGLGRWRGPRRGCRAAAVAVMRAPPRTGG